MNMSGVGTTDNVGVWPVNGGYLAGVSNPH